MSSADSADSEIPSVVVDLGTRNIRTGFSGDDAPRSIFPNLIGVPKKHRNELKLMFEKFETPAFHISLTSLAALVASGRGMGVVLSCGEGVASVHPIYYGYVPQHAIKRSDFSGIDLTFNFSKLLSEKGFSFSTAASLEIVREMKEKLCYCTPDYKAELTKTEMTSEIEQTYELPDGKRITVGKERFQCPEVLFNPSLIGSGRPGLADLVLGCIRDCEISIRNELLVGIVLEGGSTLLPGFPERLKHDLVSLVPPSMRVRVMAPPDRETLTWNGGSIITSLSHFQDFWVTKLEYEESGPNIVHRKCPGIC